MIAGKRWTRERPADLEERELALLEALQGEPLMGDPSDGWVHFLVEGMPVVTLLQAELLGRLASLGKPLPADWVEVFDKYRSEGCTPCMTVVGGHCNVYAFEPILVTTSESLQ